MANTLRIIIVISIILISLILVNTVSALRVTCGNMPELTIPGAYGNANHSLTVEATGNAAGEQISIAPETEVWNNKFDKIYNVNGVPTGIISSNWPITIIKAGNNWRFTFSNLTPGLYRANYTSVAYRVSGDGPPDSSWECAGGTPESRYNILV